MRRRSLARSRIAGARRLCGDAVAMARGVKDELVLVLRDLMESPVFQHSC